MFYTSLYYVFRGISGRIFADAVIYWGRLISMISMELLPLVALQSSEGAVDPNEAWWEFIPLPIGIKSWVCIYIFPAAEAKMQEATETILFQNTELTIVIVVFNF